MGKPKTVTTRAHQPEVVHFEDIQTSNERMSECLRIATTAAPSLATILILGETGTGKTLLAMATHNASKRAEGPLVNCSAVSDGLLESELFGHEKGAFTSAERGHKGKFELANDVTGQSTVIYTSGIAALPGIGSDPRSVFPRKKKKRPQSGYAVKSWVTTLNLYDFGPLLAGRDAEARLPPPPPEAEERSI